MYQEIESIGMLAAQPFGYAHFNSPAIVDYQVYVSESQLLLEDACVPGKTLSEQNTASRLPIISRLRPLPLMRRIFGNRLLWQRQSQISWKWIRNCG
jgi:hypothetical protein